MLDRQLFIVILGGVLLTLFWPPDVSAQSSPRVEGQKGHVNTYARPGQATQTVYIWGAIDNPGVWEIGPDTGLVELFSVVHPSGYANESLGTETQVTIRIHRTRNNEMRVVSEMPLEKLLELSPSERPSLQGQDVIEVRTVQKRKFGFQIISTVVGTLSSLTLLIFRLVDL